MIGFRLTEQQKALIESGYFRVDRDHWNAEARRWYESANYRLLTPRWKFLTPHPIQTQMVPRRFRFNLVPKGRRSGGSERWKRELVRDAITPRNYPGRFMFSAPTRTQAKALGWDDLKELVPRRELDPTKGRLGISESELTIFLRSGNRIMVVGLDEPRRVEGQALDGAVIDEIQQIKPKAWTSSIRPALSTAGRQGWAALVGRPEGKNHFYEWVRKFGIPDEETEWGLFAWPSWDILPDAEIKSARATIDDVSFAQEYGAEFVTFDGRAYHSFVRQVHAAERLSYDPTLPLIFCFDFNREPGVACVVQDQPYRGKNPSMAPEFTAVIGEVWIEKNSNTQRVADRLIQDWSHHRGLVALEGDATGGAQGSAKVAGSDWDIIKNAMRPVPGWEVRDRVPRANPLERTRVNAMNARLMAADGTIRMLIDPVAAPHVANDLDDTALLAGGSGEIDKPSKGERSIQTHMCFAAGTMVATPNGPIAVERLPERGHVIGPDGLPVEYHGGGIVRGVSDLVEVAISDGSRIRCTPDHRFLTDEGWYPAVSLAGRVLCSCVWNQETSTAFGTSGTVDTSQTGRRDDFTARYGRASADRSRKGWPSIIAMATVPTIRSTISNCSRDRNTRGITCASQGELRSRAETSRSSLGPLRRHGIVIQRIEPDAPSSSMRSHSMSGERSFDARCAARPGEAHGGILGSARVRAFPNLDDDQVSMTWIESARSVGRRSESIATARPRHALGSVRVSCVVSIGRSEPVYCPTVPSIGCFALENGVIVRNSDALGYFVVRKYPIVASSPHLSISLG